MFHWNSFYKSSYSRKTTLAHCETILAITTLVFRLSVRTSTFSVHRLKIVLAMMPVACQYQTNPAHRMLTVAHGVNKINYHS